MRPAFRLLALCAACAALSACEAPPEVGRAITAQERAAAYPPLVPLSPLLTAQPEQITPATEDALLARAAALRARAARLRRSPIGAGERARMLAGPNI
ncbi:hypothetical protein [Litorivita sp. NS0012-18]|uniref:hypothetical protein n=1 Tax=Litorivita sp. NS0012-18 TaxID=3127655 RepID=UPI0031039D7B